MAATDKPAHDDGPSRLVPHHTPRAYDITTRLHGPILTTPQRWETVGRQHDKGCHVPTGRDPPKADDHGWVACGHHNSFTDKLYNGKQVLAWRAM